MVAVALTLTETGGDSAAERLVTGYSAGYLVDAAIAALGIVVALALARTRPTRGALRRRRRAAPQPRE